MLWLVGVWAWLKKWGGCLLGGIGMIAAFVFYEAWTRKPAALPSAVSPESSEKHENAEAAVQEQEAAVREQQDIKAVEDAAANSWNETVAQTEQQTDIVADSPDAVGRMLDAAGKQQRSP